MQELTLKQKMINQVKRKKEKVKRKITIIYKNVFLLTLKISPRFFSGELILEFTSFAVKSET